MLELRNVVKTYETGGSTQNALQDVNIIFRENEFVSILGQSGSGKTTLLNIIGGLDRYTNGDLLINGVSTKQYRDGDWDIYRNNRVGFVFQSYNLIPHQSVLSNVELALTLAGVSKKERRRRAKEALCKVGLQEHMHKRPNQMSGGQMQRVAIARALVNDPDILLADEPTGALDSETSLQIMELLKEIARDRLVIMVTHNPDLAKAYSTRIVRLLDGKIIDDSQPCEVGDAPQQPKRQKKLSMSFFTALSLSFNNLRTKKGRTLLTSFAGSIGIIGIALILSISTGIQDYINGIQRDTLSSYPISIQEEENSLFTALLSQQDQDGDGDGAKPHQADAVYSNNRMYQLFNAAFGDEGEQNDMNAFKAWLDREMQEPLGAGRLSDYVSSLQYQYGIKLNTFVKGMDGEYHGTDFSDALSGGGDENQEDTGMSMTDMMGSRLSASELWEELLPGKDDALFSDLLYEQYELVAGAWPETAQDVVLILDKNNEITDVSFYALGMMEDEEVTDIFTAVMKGEEIDATQRKLSYQDVLNTTFRLVLSPDLYAENESGVWESIQGDQASLKLVIENGLELRISGILRPNPEAAASSISGTFGYTHALTEYVMKQTAEHPLVKKQLLPENENLDLLTGLPFVLTEELDPSDGEKAEKIREHFASMTPQEKEETYTSILSTPSDEALEKAVSTYLEKFSTRDSKIQMMANAYKFSEDEARKYLEDYTDQELNDMMEERLRAVVLEQYAQQAQGQIAQIKSSASGPEDIMGVKGTAAVSAAFDQLVNATQDEATLAAWYDAYMPSSVSGSTLAETLKTLGSVNEDSPTAVNIYADTFENKQAISDLIEEYNNTAPEEEKITYTDYVALMMSGVTTMVNAVSYALIGFVSISLIVSSIMIGIITYISVLERTKEIGILRSIGASKRDVSRVFNAETFIIGLASGLMGIGVTLLLGIPIDALIEALTGIQNITVLPWGAAAILVLISVCLTMLAGLLPSRMAAKKDPVAALRTE